jgi:hypothetical protein
MVIKLNAFDLAEDRSWMPVLHPDTGEPLVDDTTKEPIEIEVLCSDSKEYRRRERELNRRHVRNRRQMDPEAYATDRAVAATTGLRPAGAFADETGRVLDAKSDDDLRSLYMAFPRFRDSALEWSGDRSQYRGN